MAIDEILDEHEQSRRVQDWLRRNGLGLVGGVALGLAAVYGWRWWQDHQVQEDMRAADAYQQAVDEVVSRGVAAAPRVKALPEGTYRTLASLVLARAQVEAGQRDAALGTLRGAMPASGPLREIVELRVARLLLDGGKIEQALSTVRGDSAAVEELRGDARVAQGRRDDAREAYRRALAKAEVGSPQRGLIELKYTQVGGVPATPPSP
ncbi:tetratricopeptide repeat protein [Lysobacter sp. N42]|uniref:YfgM family protein n=1 Tax=Lysobacter sp. N42 TaxID=2545719 RepID=UPI0010430D13|nr:tetratricopeptide repeat protein [Lysobacter sp. N42]TCZ87101.1 tetratricopeptide repeat protein [Lysobacter sp. N42]